MTQPVPAPVLGEQRPAAVTISGARLSFGQRVLWDDFDLTLARGEFVAVLGPNGSGKTSLLKTLLGQYELDAGSVTVSGRTLRRGDSTIGYIPQQQTHDEGVPLRGRDLVGLGVDGQTWGLGWRNRKRRTELVDDAIAQVDARDFADAPLGLLSGGEQQRLRVAQALSGDPTVLLCDEPLLSLDPANQGRVAALIDRRRRDHGTAVLFVTHEINPILPYVDRVVYLVDGRFRIGTPNEVMTSETLSELYQTRVDVLHVQGRLIVVGADESACHGDHHLIDQQFAGTSEVAE
ncbi:ABC transporter ATP-binding protein [Williamsia sp. 1138]|uniref:Metal ABC transporter ATP-binding protein n=1 Tax=Gordonia rubripertincta TaxID=36822 RepID=A0ABT4MY71_GORRU|nr:MULTISPECIES: metal ABC transporter ATP-binding protein [Mycobacteriales]MCZ4551954.1 metal ABC transporter ATP-binding protein [Gordonia rubripertincta]OZG28146.1 ABC transporter ATP-binding protein [Williamsia sp. 1138]